MLPTSQPILKGVSIHPPGEWDKDDYDVYDGEQHVGRPDPAQRLPIIDWRSDDPWSGRTGDDAAIELAKSSSWLVILETDRCPQR